MSLTTSRSSPAQIVAYTNSYVPVPTVTASGYTQLSVGISHALAIDSNGKLFAWGLNSNGQLGDGTTVTKSSPIQIGNDNWSLVYAAYGFSVALRSDKIAFGWGLNTNGELGSAGTAIGTATSSPVQINSTSWTNLTTGYNHVVGIKSDATLWTWGLNSSGQLGINDYASRSSPVQVGNSSYLQISANGNYTTAIDTNFKMVLFGDNTFGEAQPSSIQSWTQIAGNDEYTLAIRNDGLLFGWGLNTTGQLGLGDTLNRSSPTQIGSFSWRYVAVNGGGTGAAPIAIRNDYMLFTWGNNNAGQIGDSTTLNKSSPVQIGSSSWAFVAAGKSHKAAITTTGSMYLWGLNNNGQLGVYDIVNRSSPVQVANAGSWSQVALMDFVTIGLTSTNLLYSWGQNNIGQLGTNDVISRSSPTQIGASSWSLVYASVSTAYAVKTNKKLYAWGLNNTYQLGTNDNITRSSPVQIHSGDWSSSAGAIGAYYNSTATTMAIQTDGTLWAWGSKTALMTSDFAVPTPTYSWTQIAAGSSHFAALRSDGRLFTWGNNAYGQLGEGTTTNKNSPNLVTGLAGVVAGTWDESGYWKYVAARDFRTYAIRSDGSLWTWGDNAGYHFGLGDALYRSSPAQLGANSSTSWSQVSAGASHLLLVDTLGKLYVWGNNTYRQLGQGGTEISISPRPQMYATLTPFKFIGGEIGDYLPNPNAYSTYFNSSVFNNYAGLQWTNSNGSYPNTVVPFGSSDYTIEAWVYIPTQDISTYKGVFYVWLSGHGMALFWNGATLGGTYRTWLSIAFQIGGSGTINSNAVYGATQQNYDTRVQFDTWYHLAMVRTGSILKCYINGVSQSLIVSADTNNYVDKGAIYVGAQGNAGYAYSGYITNIRLVSSAVYSGTSFTVPTSPLTAISGTTFLGFQTGDLEDKSGVQTPLEIYWTWFQQTYRWNITPGNVNNPFNLTPVAGKSIAQVSAGANHSTVITTEGKLYSWGDNRSGQVGVSSSEHSWIQIEAGGTFTLALRSDRTLWVWGNNPNSQLGTGYNLYVSSPVQIGTSSWLMIASRTYTSFGITMDGRLFGWGYNNSGNIGINNIDPRSSPTQIGTSSWTKVATNTVSQATIAIRSDGTLWSWGYNNQGQLGIGDTITRSSPVQIGTDSNYIDVNTGNGSMYALKNDYTLWSWGFNTYGELGLGNTVWRSSPTQISGSWSFIGYWGFALRIDNTAWAWGNNPNGDLGLGDSVARSSPTQIGTSSWTMVGPGGGITADGRLFGWGINTNGYIGDNTTVAKASPIQINAERKFSNMFWGITNNYAVTKTTNLLFAWGEGTLNKFLDGTSVNRSSPIQVYTHSIVSSATQIGTSSWSSVSAGSYHTLAIDTVGRLFAWGDNTTNQLGLTSPSTALDSVNADSTILLKDTDNAIIAWGPNDVGQLGDLTTVAKSTPTLLTPPTNLNYFVKVAKAKYNTAGHVLAIDNVGGLYGWGLNTGGLIGDGTAVTKSSPVFVNGGSWASVAAGPSNSLAVHSNGTIWGWGQNNFGQSGFLSWIKISAGQSHTLAIRSDNALVAWGLGTSGQLGDNTLATKSSPVVVPGLWKDVVAGITSSLGIRMDGTLWAWGNNTNGQLGTGAAAGNYSSPTAVSTSTFTTWSKLALWDHALAIDSSNRLWTWGYDLNGQLGDNSTTARSVPYLLDSTNSWTDVSVGLNSSFALRSNGTLWTWGRNDTGALGLGDTIGRSSPVQLSGSWNKIGAGYNHTLALKSDSTLWGWGNNNQGQIGIEASFSMVAVNQTINLYALRTDGTLLGWGQAVALGDNTVTAKSSPVIITAPGTSSWNFITANKTSNGNQFALAIDNLGKLWSWGTNGQGQLGNNLPVATTLSSPVLLTSGNSWSMASAGGAHASGIATDGTLWTWGYNITGGLGNISTINRSSPVQITTATNWATTSAGGSHTIAINTLGQVFLWGSNGSGELGDGTTNHKSSPVQLAGSRSWIMASASAGATYLLSTDYTLWALGANTVGQLGTNDVILRSSPVQVAGGGSWTFVYSGSSSVSAIKTDGTLYTWGTSANAGILGVGDTVSRSSPTQIAGGGSWTMAFANPFYISIGLKADRRIFMWGNMNTNTTNATTINRSSPIQVNASTFPAFSSPVQIGTSSWSSVSAGLSFSTAQKIDGTLYTWGLNNFGQLGVVPASGVAGEVWVNKFSPVQILSRTSLWNSSLDITSWAAVSAGGTHVLALHGGDPVTQNSLWTWGSNTTGQLGLNVAVASGRSSPTQVAYLTQYNDRSSPAQIGSARSWTTVAAGFSFGVALRNDGTLWAWGDNKAGMLGQGDNGAVNNSYSIIQIGSKSNWTAISAGFNHAVALDSTGAIYTWGSGLYGQVPTNATDTISWAKVITGQSANYILGIRNDGRLYAWGLGSSGNLATVDTQNYSSPMQIPGSYTTAATGQTTSLAIRTDGTLWAWGDNGNSKLGDGTNVAKSSPIQVGIGYSWSNVYTGNAATAAITNDGKLFTWGNDQSLGYLMGDVTVAAIRSSPVQVQVGSSWIMATLGLPATSFAIRSDGSLFGWGQNNFGQLGNNSVINRSSATQIGTSFSWTQVISGDSHTVALRTDNTVWGWGYNGYGQLGQGDTLLRSSPVQVATGSYTQVIATYFATMLYRNDNTLWVMGYNGNGQLGDGTTINRSSPVQVLSSATSWVSLAGIANIFAAVKNDGTLWSWGYNAYGVVQHNITSNNRSSPVQVGTTTENVITSPTKIGNSSWINISAGSTHTMAITSDKRLFGWGNNSAGHLGVNDTINRSSPVQVTSIQTGKPGTGTNSYILVQAGDSSTMAIQSDNTLWTWGRNDAGHLALADAVWRSSPVQVATLLGPIYGNKDVMQSSPTQIGSLSSWTFVAAGYSHSMAITKDEAIFLWGSNNSGQLGLGDTFGRSSPTQITTAGNAYSTGALTSASTTAIRDTTSLLFNWGVGTMMGDNTAVAKSVPTAIFTGTLPGSVFAVPIKLNALANKSFTQVAVGTSVVTAMQSNNVLNTWGTGLVGQLGTNNIITTSSPSTVGGNPNTNTPSPVQIGTSSWINVSAGTKHVLAVDPNYSLYGWGGIAASNPINPIYSWKSIKAGERHVVGLRGDGSLWTWGNNLTGQLGMGDTLDRGSPSRVNTSSYTYIAASHSNTAAITADGKLWVWGLNSVGQLGLSDTFNRSSPVQVGLLTNWQSVSIGISHTLALNSSGVLFGWGLNTNGQIGNNDLVNRSSPVQVGTPEFYSWSQVSAGPSNSVAIRSDGILFTWGANTNGQLGDNTIVGKSSPIQIGFHKYKKVVAGGGLAQASVFALRTDGVLFGWGYNTNGQLGVNDATVRSSPVIVGGNLNLVFNDIEFTAALGAQPQGVGYNGAVYTWGNNANGQLGMGDTISRSSPSVVNASWNNIGTGGASFNILRDSIGQLYTVGVGLAGELGDAKTLAIQARSSPVQVGVYNATAPVLLSSAYSYTNISAGTDYSIVSTSGGSLYAWGINQSYNLGIFSNELIVSSPVQIGTNVTAGSQTISAGDGTTAGYIKNP